MTYDDWKGRSDRDDAPEPQRSGWCSVCRHWSEDECDCPCCNESETVGSNHMTASGQARADAMADAETLRINADLWWRTFNVDRCNVDLFTFHGARLAAHYAFDTFPGLRGEDTSSRRAFATGVDLSAYDEHALAGKLGPLARKAAQDRKR